MAGPCDGARKSMFDAEDLDGCDDEIEAAKSGEERERREVLTGRSIAMWRPRQRNRPPKQFIAKF